MFGTGGWEVSVGRGRVRTGVRDGGVGRVEGGSRQSGAREVGRVREEGRAG